MRTTTDQDRAKPRCSDGGPPDPRGRRWVVVVVLAVLAAAGVVVVLALGTSRLAHGEVGAVGEISAVLRFARYATTLLAVGGFVFLAAVHPLGAPRDRPSRLLTAAAAGAGVVGTVLALPVHAAAVTGEVAAATDGGALGQALSSGYGRSVVLGTIGLALVGAAALRVPAPVAVGAGAAGAVLAVGAFLLTGHTATAQPRALALGANLLHVAAASTWLGGLVLLPVALAAHRRGEPADRVPVGATPGALAGARLVARFSTLASGALLVVAAAGAALAWAQVRAVVALSTPYGRVLLAKVGLVGVVVAVGAYNNRRLVPLIRRGGSWQRLVRAVRLEAVGLLAVLVATALLVSVTPARTAAGIGGQITVSAAFGDAHEVLAIVEPAHPGRNDVHLYLYDDQGRLSADADALSLAARPLGGGEPTAAVAPWVAGPGHWTYGPLHLRTAGQWALVVRAEVDGAELVAELPVPVGVEGQPWEDG